MSLHRISGYVSVQITESGIGDCDMTDLGCSYSTWVQGILKPAHPCLLGDGMCLDVGPRPLLDNIRHGLIDPDTPKDAYYKKDADGTELKLVVSGTTYQI